MTPTRFRAAEQRNARLGRTLKWIGRVGEVDEALMDRIALAFTERDETGAALAAAIRTRGPGRVAMADVRTALRDGIAAVTDAPAALADLFAEAEQVPDWVDWDRIERGSAVFNRLGRNAADVLLQLSLIGGYRFGGPTDLLVATGGLTGAATRRRIAETQQWGYALGEPGALRPPGDRRPAGLGWQASVHVRVMHALVNHTFEPRWDVGRWGLPINQADLAATLGLFDGALLIGTRTLGVPVGRRDAAALMHLWKYVGHLLGVHPDFLVDDERARHRINYHLLRAQDGLTAAGPQLAQAIFAAQRERHYPHWPAPLQHLRGRYEQERLASMLTVYLGRDSMHELGLPVRPPWAHAYLLPLNTARYRLPLLSGRRTRWGRTSSREIIDSYFGEEPAGLGELSA